PALTQMQTLLGTPDYLAPEQARDPRAADARSDLYSLGCTFYFLLGGQVPFPGDSQMDKLLKHCTEKPVPVKKVRQARLAELRRAGKKRDDDAIPREVRAVVRKLMAKHPENRFQTAAQVAAILTALMPTGIRIPFPQPDGATGRGRRRSRWLGGTSS